MLRFPPLVRFPPLLLRGGCLPARPGPLLLNWGGGFGESGGLDELGVFGDLVWDTLPPARAQLSVSLTPATRAALAAMAGLAPRATTDADGRGLLADLVTAVALTMAGTTNAPPALAPVPPHTRPPTYFPARSGFLGPVTPDPAMSSLVAPATAATAAATRVSDLRAEDPAEEPALASHPTAADAPHRELAQCSQAAELILQLRTELAASTAREAAAGDRADASGLTAAVPALGASPPARAMYPLGPGDDPRIRPSEAADGARVEASVLTAATHVIPPARGAGRMRPADDDLRNRPWRLWLPWAPAQGMRWAAP
jgi:hypothetical protein